MLRLDRLAFGLSNPTTIMRGAGVGCVRRCGTALRCPQEKRCGQRTLLDGATGSRSDGGKSIACGVVLRREVVAVRSIDWKANDATAA